MTNGNYLNEYEYRLLDYYKRVCKENEGICDATLWETAMHCQMSRLRVVEARNALQEMGYIKVRPTGFTKDTPFEVLINHDKDARETSQ